MADTLTQLDSLALLAITILLLALPPKERETWEQNVVFIRSHIFRSVLQVLVRAVSLLIFGDLHGRFHILCLSSSCSRTCMMGTVVIILCDEPLVNYVLELGLGFGCFPNSW